MGLIQRFLARFGYVRIADYGLMLTPYGVVPSHEGWRYQSLPPAPVPYAEPPAATVAGYGPFNVGPRAGQPAQALAGPLGAQGTQQVYGAMQAANAEQTEATATGEIETDLALGTLRAESDGGDGNTTHAQPLAEFRLPLAASSPPADADSPRVARSSWERPLLATVVVSANSLISKSVSDEDEKTLFSEPPLHEPRSTTPSQ